MSSAHRQSEISRFFGIRIPDVYNDHAPPHFHAEFAGEILSPSRLGVRSGTREPEAHLWQPCARAIASAWSLQGRKMTAVPAPVSGHLSAGQRGRRHGAETATLTEPSSAITTSRITRLPGADS
jgi:hypothetical protein